jgi:hypothetical protein
MRRTGAKGAFRVAIQRRSVTRWKKGAFEVATQRRSVTRWQKSASRNVQKKGSGRQPCGGEE